MHPASAPDYAHLGPSMTPSQRALAHRAIEILMEKHNHDHDAGPAEIAAALQTARTGPARRSAVPIKTPKIPARQSPKLAPSPVPLDVVAPHLIRAACSITLARPEILSSDIRFRPYSHARYAVWFVLYRRTKLDDLGQLFNRDHTSVLAGVRRARNLLAFDNDFQHLVHSLQSTLDTMLATRGLESTPENHVGDGQPSGLPAAHGSPAVKSAN
jgi:hypothetical protein